MKFAYVFAILAVAIGGLFLMSLVTGFSGGLQTATGVAVALGFAAIPMYAVGR